MCASSLTNAVVSAWPCTATDAPAAACATGSPIDMRARPPSTGPSENLKVNASPGRAPGCIANADAACGTSVPDSGPEFARMVETARTPQYSSMLTPMRIGVTLGDPSGIGPEIVRARRRRRRRCRRLRRRAARAPASRAELRARSRRSTAWCPARRPTPTGRAQVAYLEAAVADARAGKLDALVTAPIHKASCLARRLRLPRPHRVPRRRALGAPRVTMMFAGPRLRVVAGHHPRRARRRAARC